MMRLLFTSLILLGTLTSTAWGQNLLRNGDFQDDWLTLKPEVKNHHWCYTSELYHRRDFNPDGWACKGSWVWQNADRPAGQRQLLLKGPGSSVTQRVNWVLVHDSKAMGNMADAGGFPSIKGQKSLQPSRVVRDLTLRVRLSGQNVPAKAGNIELGLCPPGGLTISDPLGTPTPPTVLATVPLPEGTYPARELEVKLAAEQWLKAAGKDPVLPGTVQVVIRYQANQGQIELGAAELTEAGPASPNLLPNGGFEEVAAMSTMPAGWTGPSKYRYFPGRLYYIFNTWHNGAFDNRGKVRLDDLVRHSGAHSLQMIVPAGDEVAMSSQPIVLKQTTANLIEVQAMVKTDSLAVLNIDAVDEKGDRLDGHCFIHMAPHSIGTNEWRLIRQVFRPRRPVESIRLMLAARGVNGYTLDDTAPQPQNNVVGTIWWDDVKLFEPESTAAELQGRGVAIPAVKVTERPVRIHALDLGERMLGENTLTVTVVSRIGHILLWEFTSPTGKKSVFRSAKLIKSGVLSQTYELPYVLTELCTEPYTEYRGKLSVLGHAGGSVIGTTELWFSTWTVPIKLELGALYLQPDQKQQLVRMNFGMSAAEMKKLASVRLEVVRRGSGEVLRKTDVPATTAILAAQLEKIPVALRDDFSNLLLTDLDVSFLPLQAFHDPQRNWFVRATARTKDDKVLASVESPPFCRLSHDPPQSAVQTVAVKKNLLYVNGKPWMPWGVVYGHCPVYDGPADPGKGKYLDLHNLPGWSMYDGFGYATNTRSQYDFNCDRYVAASITPIKTVEDKWTKENRYASSVYVVPGPVFSIVDLQKAAIVKADKNKKGSDLASYLAFVKSSPMVISTAPGIEEAFGLFTDATPAQLKGLEQVVQHLRKETARPVMVGHGGYWNRLEFEKAPFFDIYDPETEPWYPAHLHTDLAPLVKGKDQVIWLRPQMYEDVPYERWRFHTYVELMRGCCGWQMAHGPGDASLFRGLHGEMEFIKPIAYSEDPGPKIDIEPRMEQWSRKHQGKTYLIAATTRGMGLGKWSTSPGRDGWPGDVAGIVNGRIRVTSAPHLHLSDANSYGADQKVDTGPTIHGLHYLPDARTWPAGTKVVQWVRVGTGKARPENMVLFVKGNGRWTHAASWGTFDPSDWSKDRARSFWFLRSFYRHANGFLGWGENLLDKAKQHMPGKTVNMGELPLGKEHDAFWVRVEIPLDKLGITPDMMVDGVAFAHQEGQIEWGQTYLEDPKGKRTVIWGDSLEHPQEELAKTKITVAGLKKGTKIRVLFEDRDIVADDGYFIDDFRGQDLYQRFGGGYGVGYGNGKVALHLYEIARP